MVRPTSNSVSFTSECQSTGVVLVWPPGVAGKVLSVLPSCCLCECFLGIGSLNFTEFWHGARYLYEVTHDCQSFWQKVFLHQKVGKWFKNRSFLNIKKNLIFSKSYVGKNLVPEKQVKMLSANQIAGFLNQLFLQCKLMDQLHFLHVNTKWQKLKVKIFLVGHGQRLDVAKTISEKWADGIIDYFECWCRFTKNKSWSKMFWVSIFKNGCGQSGHGTLKLPISQTLKLVSAIFKRQMHFFVISNEVHWEI